MSSGLWSKLTACHLCLPLQWEVLILAKLRSRDWGGRIRGPILRCGSRPGVLVWDNSYEGHIPNPRTNEQSKQKTMLGDRTEFSTPKCRAFLKYLEHLKTWSYKPGLSCFQFVNPRVLFLSRCSELCNLNSQEKNIKKPPNIGRGIFSMFL